MVGALGFGFGFGPRSGPVTGGTPGPTPALPVFTPEAETTALSDAMTAQGYTPSSKRIKTMNRLIRRLKAKGVWSKLSAFYVLAAANETAASFNWKNPAQYRLTKSGAPTFTADDGYAATGVADFLDTGLAANLIAQNDHHIALYSKTVSSSEGTEFGAINGTSNGIALGSKRSAGTLGPIVYSQSGRLPIGGSSNSDGSGFLIANRTASNAVQAWRNATSWATNNTASTAPLTSTLRILTPNGETVSTGRKISFACVGSSLTEAEQRELYGAVVTFIEDLQYGELDYTDPGVGQSDVTADLIIYGTTSHAVTAAFEAVRQGLTVAICGGWRDRHIGGLTAGGLGSMDWESVTDIGGLARWWYRQVNLHYGRNDAMSPAQQAFNVEPRVAGWYFKKMLAQANAPVFWSGGVASVAKTGTRITSFTTVDGRTFTGSYFIDCSYEMDLAAMAGVSYVTGREAAGSGNEAKNGIQYNTAGFSQRVSGVDYRVDPWNVPGDPSSGLLFPLTTRLDQLPPIGTADSKTQAFNFRLSVVNGGASRKVDFGPAIPPPGYDVAKYELHLRIIAQSGLTSISQMTRTTGVSTENGIQDMNSTGAISTNLHDPATGSSSYVTASYSQREAIWKAQENFIRGLFYICRYGTDPRIPAALKTDVAGRGLANTHFLEPHPNDEMFWPPAMYIREMRRMVSPVIVDANELFSNSPANRNAIALTRYPADSHFAQLVAHEYSPGQWQMLPEGGIGIVHSGLGLVPFEACVPSASECTNLGVTFGVSSTHTSFGAIRMEFTGMQIGQSLAVAAAMAKEGGNANLQTVAYGPLKTRLLATPSLSGEVAPVLTGSA